MLPQPKPAVQDGGVSMNERRREPEHLDKQGFVNLHWFESPLSDWLSRSDRPADIDPWLLREVVHMFPDTWYENERLESSAPGSTRLWRTHVCDTHGDSLP